MVAAVLGDGSGRSSSSSSFSRSSSGCCGGCFAGLRGRTGLRGATRPAPLLLAGDVDLGPAGLKSSAADPFSAPVSDGAHPASLQNDHNDTDYYRGNSSVEASAAALGCKGYQTRHALTESTRAFVLVLVGLPGRGKSFISRKLEGFCQWQGKRTKVFNAGKYRREAEAAAESGRADFFDPSNSAALSVRKQAATTCLHDLLDFLDAGGQVGIFDATNSTNDRRVMILEEARKRTQKYHVIFVEVLCDDPEVLDTNFRNKVLHSPDFAGMTLEEGIKDLQERVKMYEDRYETIEDDDMSYIKLFNMSSKVMVNRVFGSATKSLLPFLMGTHIGTRPIWLARTGQVPINSQSDARLTDVGQMSARRLSAFVKRRLREYYGGTMPEKPMRVLSSTVSSCVQTVHTLLQSDLIFRAQVFKQVSALNPIDRGRLSGPWWVDATTDKPPFEDMSCIDPAHFRKWQANKMKTRFPGGESYMDVVGRVESALFEMEYSTKPVLCVSHVTVLQVLMSYYRNTAVEDSWDVAVPNHHVVEIRPTLGGTYEVEVLDYSSESLAMEPMTPVRLLSSENGWRDASPP